MPEVEDDTRVNIVLPRGDGRLERVEIKATDGQFPARLVQQHVV
jgi:hypothetical protein